MNPTAKTSLYEKLQKIQSELKVPKGQYNEFSSFYYRSCGDILTAVKPILKREGLTIILSDDMTVLGSQKEEITPRFYVKATAQLTDGTDSILVSAFAREAENKKGMDSSQITGSSSSYARKYALNGLFAIDDERDPDSMDNVKNKQTKKSDDDKPWFNSKDKSHGEKVISIHEATKLLGENLVKKLRETFKISKASAKALEAWKPKTPPPAAPKTAPAKAEVKKAWDK